MAFEIHKNTTFTVNMALSPMEWMVLAVLFTRLLKLVGTVYIADIVSIQVVSYI